jgi:hypothetical protein
MEFCKVPFAYLFHLFSFRSCRDMPTLFVDTHSNKDFSRDSLGEFIFYSVFDLKIFRAMESAKKHAIAGTID